MDNKRATEHKMFGNKTKIISVSLISVLCFLAILGFVSNRICSGYWAVGGLIREGSGIVPGIMTHLHFSALFEIMLICVIVVICGIGAVIVIAQAPLSVLKVAAKNAEPVTAGKK
jgi:hypothetical protein